MALCVHHNQAFLVVLLLLSISPPGSQSADERLATCGTQIDMLTNINLYSGVLKVNMPTSFAAYQDPTLNKHCDIMVIFGGGVNLQLELFQLDIMPISSDVNACSTGLEVRESTGRQVYGQRLCMDGWEWEKRHRERKQEKKVVQNSPVIFRLISEGPYRGSGFKVHFNLFRPTWPCSSHREFKCERLQRCVHDDITCDGWDDCGDDSDESEDAGCELLTIPEIFAVIIGIFLFIGTVAITVVFLIKYRQIIKRDRLLRMESKLALEDERRSIREPVLSFPHRFNSMESMNKSQYSRRMDVDSLMDRMELDKADRLASIKDNMSERSYKSNPRHRSNDNSDRYPSTSRKYRAASQASLAKDKSGMQGSGSNHGSRPDLDREKDGSEYEPSRNGRSRSRRRGDRSDEEYGSDSDRRRQSRDRARPYDDEENDSDGERRRRRRKRSRDRRRYDRSSDEEYDSDSDRWRRRRSRDRRRYDSGDDDDGSDRDSRKRRSRRYDSDEDNDSDRERRRRSRDRRRRNSDEYDSDRDRRRRSRDKRQDSDEYDSDRDRRRRRSRDRRSRDLSEDKDDKSQSRSRDNLKEQKEKPEEMAVTLPEEKPKPPKEPEKKHPSESVYAKVPYREKERPRQTEELPAERQRVTDHNAEPKTKYPPPSTPPKSDDLRRNNYKTPNSNGVPAKQEPNNGTAWVPRSERKRNRRSRGDAVAPSDDIYEDVVPRRQQENPGYREEAV